MRRFRSVEWWGKSQNFSLVANGVWLFDKEIAMVQTLLRHR